MEMSKPNSVLATYVNLLQCASQTLWVIVWGCNIICMICVGNGTERPQHQIGHDPYPLDCRITHGPEHNPSLSHIEWKKCGRTNGFDPYCSLNSSSSSSAVRMPQIDFQRAARSTELKADFKSTCWDLSRRNDL